MELAISVIVTVHNAEKYLQECLDSVIDQTFTDIEILCIDGGSTDISPEILKQYAQKDSRIKIINDSNTSYGHKINIGIEQAQGEYIAVLESDDMYEPNMLEELYAIALQEQPDFVNGDYREFLDINGSRFFMPHQLYHKQPYNSVIHITTEPDNIEIMDRFWTGIYKKDFIQKNNIKLNESAGASFQDMSFRFLLSVLAGTVYHLNIPVYRYRMDNPNSSMKDSTKTVIIADEHDYLSQELEKRAITDPVIWKWKYYWKYMDFFGNIHRLYGDGREALFERYLKELAKDIKHMPDYSEESYPFASEKILTNPQEFMQSIEDYFNKFQKYNQEVTNLLYQVTLHEKIIIFGCGQRGKSIYTNYMQSVFKKVQCFTDNNKQLWNKKICNVIVLSPIETVERYPNALYVIAIRDNNEQVKQQLLSLNINETNIICMN